MRPTRSRRALRQLVGLARARGIPVATHLLESERDTRRWPTWPAAGARYGRDPPRPCRRGRDLELLAGLGVPAVHCPRSNALLGCGTAPVPELLDAGMTLGLGTDSPASALTFDMWDEMRAAILVARARAQRPDALSAERVLRMATIDGARAIGLAEFDRIIDAS